MNIVLFTNAELDIPLALHDRRAEHILKVLNCRPGGTFDVGLIDGPRGKACLLACTSRGLELAFTWTNCIPELYPVELAVGMARPQTIRKILSEVTTLGVRAIHFICTEKSEKSYRASRLWTEQEYKGYVQAGVEQSFCTRFPKISLYDNVKAYLDTLDNRHVELFALDNYEAQIPLQKVSCTSNSGILAVGAERGWSSREREMWRGHGFTLVGLGSRVLRTETACLVGLALVLAKLNYI